jgi:hypothetical protein
LSKEAIDDSGGTSSLFRPLPVACSMACDEKEVKREFQLSVVGPCEADSQQRPGTATETTWSNAWRREKRAVMRVGVLNLFGRRPETA